MIVLKTTQVEDYGLNNVYRCSRGSVPVDRGVEATDRLASGRALGKEGGGRLTGGKQGTPKQQNVC